MSNICGGCGKKVLSGTIVSALDQQFHGACFKCGLCRKDLDGPFYGCDQLPFCESCIDRAEELDKKGELRRLVQQNAPSAPPSEPVVVAARPRSPDPEVAPASSASAFAPPSPSSDDPVCHKCNVAVTSGTVVNALDASWHEKCFKCFECNGELDSFYNFQGFPFCGNCIDAVEERGTVAASSSSAAAAAAAAVGAPPKITNAFSGKSADSNQSDRPHLPAPGSSFSSSFSAPPSAPPANASWQDRALLAEEQVRQLYEKLAMVKVALSEERRISAEEYNVLQQELEEEKKRRELLEKMRQQSAGESNNEEVASLKRRIQDLERDLVELRARQQGDNRLSEALLELEQSQKRFRDVSNRLREAENALDIARASANAAPSFDGGAFDIPAPPGGGPPPPPPPPPPPASGINTAPLKINRTGQSAAMTAKEEEHNPQADLINELKKGRPMLRRTAAQRPSKREILTKNANARMAETERPDPSVVKGADTSNPSAKKMAVAAEKTAELAVERDDRVKAGNLKMKVHRNKFLDQFLDTL